MTSTDKKWAKWIKTYHPNCYFFVTGPGKDLKGAITWLGLSLAIGETTNAPDTPKN